MRRDIYHDYVTQEDVVEAGIYASPREDRAKALVERFSVSNVLLWMNHDMRSDACTMSISFGSRAWTGTDDALYGLKIRLLFRKWELLNLWDRIYKWIS